MIRDILDYLGNKIGELELPDGTSEEVWAAKLAVYAIPPENPTQYDKDLSRYIKRAAAKPKIIAKMAADNVTRVRNGTWTSAQLISLTQDAQLRDLLANIETLSFEIAIGSISALTNPLMTSEIKAEWVQSLSDNLFMNG